MPLNSPALLGMLAIAAVAFVLGSWQAGAAWRSAALRYPDRGRDSGPTRRFRFATVRVALDGRRPLTYRNCVDLELSDAGVRLSVWGPFQLGHPPMRIPWDAVLTSESTFTPLGDAARLTLDHEAELLVYGAAGQAILGSFGEITT